MTELTLRVCDIRRETARVRSVVLEAVSDTPLPAWTAGAHIRVKLPSGGDRAYSLVDLPEWRTGRHYAIGTLLEPDSTGGSRYIHSLEAGDRVRATGPANHFELQEEAAPALLLAGGIGITPLFSMAASLARQGRDFRLHYLGRAEGELAFLAQLSGLCGDRLSVHYDSSPAGRPDFAALLRGQPPAAQAYVCGPAGMIEAVRSAWAAAGRPAAGLHSELFAATPATAAGDRSFEVEIGSTGQVVTVAPGQSIIAALEQAGVEVVYDCRRGDCGICQTGVVEGIPDHRDVVLSDEEKASNKVMQICVSRARTPKLVLDL